MRGRLHLGDRASFVLCALLLAGSAVAFVVLVALHRIRGAAWGGLLGVALVAGAAALLGWMRASRLAARFAAVEATHADELEDELDDRSRTIEELRGALEREHRARQATRDWALELRRKVLDLQHEQGVLGGGDVRELVLRTAMSLLDADKGLLLAHEDDDGDGDLDLVCALGFDGDPEHNEVAQRFAREVLERDQIVRERNAGDVEIRNLVAIPMYLRDRFHGVVVCCNLRGDVDAHDEDVLLALGDHAGAILHNARLHGRLRGSYLATVAMLADAIDAKDPLLRGHCDDVAQLVGRVAARLGLAADEREALVFASLLHDIGKIGVSERILLKPAALTPDERAVVELHPRIGYRLIEHVPELRLIAPAILHHHERFDGDGYPSGLAGEGIPLAARVIAVADSFSAMTVERPYRARMTVEAACAELERCAGTQFDPQVVKLFVAEVRRSVALLERPPQDLATSDPELEVRRRRDEAPLPLGAYASVDGTTLLYTRRHLHEAAQAQAHRADLQRRGFAILLVELSELERINREQGYRAGDEALRRAARVLEGTAGRVGGEACRFGGRTLALVVPSADERIADLLVEELSGDLADGPSVRIAHAVWRRGDDGDAVVERARTELRRSRSAVPQR